MKKSTKIAIAAIVLIGAMGVECGGGDRSSGVKVKPGDSCKTEGSSGSYDHWWYTCKMSHGQLVWVKNKKNEIGG